MNRSIDTWVVVLAQVIEAPGRNEISYSFLSRRGKGINPLSAVDGSREWLPVLTEQVERFTSLDEAHAVSTVWGGNAYSSATMERLGGEFVYRVGPSDSGMEL